MWSKLTAELLRISKTFCIFVPLLKRPCGEMVDSLVSGASASRRVGSTPIMGTHKVEEEFSDSSSFLDINCLI